MGGDHDENRVWDSLCRARACRHGRRRPRAYGIWQTEPDDGAFAFVELDSCGEAVCGTIIRTFNSEGEYESENIGRQIVIDMVPQGDGRYEGSVWRPSNDRIYIGRMSLGRRPTRWRCAAACSAG